MELRIGTKIKDNDPRMPNRVLRVIEFGNKGSSKPLSSPEGATHLYAIYEGRWRSARISLTRIFADGKPRRSGWSVVP